MEKILHISKSINTGGAAIACSRLVESLQTYGTFTYQCLVQELPSQWKEKDYYSVGEGILWNKRCFANLAIEKGIFLFHEKSPRVRFQFSLANTGTDISNHPLIRDADIIHFHWIHQGFISLRGIEKIFRTGKPVIWTLHDMWPFTGGCHYAGSCTGFRKNCGMCPYLRTAKERDISYHQHRQKEKIFENANLTFVAPSAWMASRARESSLAGHHPVIIVPNAINTEIFRPLPQHEARNNLKIPSESFYLLFGAANVGETRKGFSLLLQAIDVVREKFPKVSDDVALLMFGKIRESFHFPFPVMHLSYISDVQQLVSAYNAASVFVLPSLEDNLPNTVMEALVCGIPVIAFRSGGVAEMVDHLKTGYLAEPGSAEDLARGILWAYENANNVEIREACRNKVLQNYRPEVVVSQYDQVYKKILER